MIRAHPERRGCHARAGSTRAGGTWAGLWRVRGQTGLVAYLYLHLVILSTLLRGPEAWDGLVELFRQPVFLAFDLLLVAGLAFHGLNGLRVALVGSGLLVDRHKAMAAGSPGRAGWPGRGRAHLRVRGAAGRRIEEDFTERNQVAAPPSADLRLAGPGGVRGAAAGAAVCMVAQHFVVEGTAHLGDRMLDPHWARSSSRPCCWSA